MKFNSFLKTCHEKGVLSKLSIYIVVTWVLLQVMSVTAEPLGLPKKSVTYLIIILLIGFPLYIFLVWKYYLATLESENETLDENGNPIKGKILKSPFYKMYFAMLTTVSVVISLLVFLIIENNFGKSIELKKLEAGDKIGVLKFGNNTGDKKFDIVGKMAADWIIHGITENNLAQVVSQEIVNNYSGIIKNTSTTGADGNVLETYFKPSKIISGNYYLANNRLIFQSTITDGELDKTFISLKPVDCDPNNPLGCIELIKQRILGYLITEDQQELNLQESPPIYEAYQDLLNAKEVNSNTQTYIDLLNSAVKKDSTFFEPKVLRVAYYYNQGDYQKSDSLRLAIESYAKTNKRQMNLLSFYEDLTKGNNKQAYYHLKKEYDLAPFDLQSNASMMVVALQYVYKPEEIDKIFNEVSMAGIDIENCSACKNRIYVKALADIELNKYAEVVALLEPLFQVNNNIALFKRPLLSAYIRLGNDDAVDAFLAKEALISAKSDWVNLLLHTGNEYLLKNEKEKADNFFDKIILAYEDTEINVQLAKAHYYRGDYVASENAFVELLKDNQKNIENNALLAISYYKNGKERESLMMVEKLNQLRSKYQFGEVDYQLARYFAVVDEDKKALQHLLKAIADGQNYTSATFQNDPHFNRLKKDNDFEKIMNFWH
jgi:thioredoxin-like negative regulator of GroEL